MVLGEGYAPKPYRRGDAGPVPPVAGLEAGRSGRRVSRASVLGYSASAHASQRPPNLTFPRGVPAPTGARSSSSWNLVARTPYVCVLRRSLAPVCDVHPPRMPPRAVAHVQTHSVPAFRALHAPAGSLCCIRAIASVTAHPQWFDSVTGRVNERLARYHHVDHPCPIICLAFVSRTSAAAAALPLRYANGAWRSPRRCSTPPPGSPEQRAPRLHAARLLNRIHHACSRSSPSPVPTRPFSARHCTALKVPRRASPRLGRRGSRGGRSRCNDRRGRPRPGRPFPDSLSAAFRSRRKQPRLLLPRNGITHARHLKRKHGSKR